jgi:hypothetical protein
LMKLRGGGERGDDQELTDEQANECLLATFHVPNSHPACHLRHFRGRGKVIRGKCRC